MRRLSIPLALALAAMLPAAVSAKEVVAAKVCGKSDCRTVKDRKALLALAEGGPPTDPPDHAVPWYRVRLTVGTGGGQRDSFSTVVAPALGLVRGSDESGAPAWLPVSREAVRRYRAITRGLEPFPASSLTGLDVPGPPKVRVDEVVLPPDDAKPAGGAPVWPWIAGGAALLGVVALLVLRARRRAGPGGSPEPAEG